MTKNYLIVGSRQDIDRHPVDNLGVTTDESNENSVTRAKRWFDQVAALPQYAWDDLYLIEIDKDRSVREIAENLARTRARAR